MTDTNKGLSQKILDYIATRADEKLEKFDKNAEKQKANASPETVSELTQQLNTERATLLEHYKPQNWLTDAALRATQLQFVSHALKFIHSDARGSSLYANSHDQCDNSFIATTSLDKISLDIVGNAAALDVGKLLSLEHEGTRLIDSIRQDDLTPLLAIADDTQQAQNWLNGFKQVFAGGPPSSHKLGKQSYWPLRNDHSCENHFSDENYHLLIPLHASSLSQYCFEQIQLNRYSEEQIALRNYRRKENYSKQTIDYYPDIAVQSFGGTKPQNISQLNSQRGGKAYLFSCCPPQWQKQVRYPLYIRSVFTHYFEYLLRDQINALQKYLERVQTKESNSVIKQARENGLDDIVFDVLNRAASIQNLDACWSKQTECQLPLEEQLWLDPLRAKTDPEFFDSRDQDEWQKDVANNFARWLSKRLENKKLAFGKVEQGHLRSLIEAELRLNLKEIDEVIL